MLVSFEVYQRAGPRPGLAPEPGIQPGAGPWALSPWLEGKAPSPSSSQKGLE